MNLAPQTTKPPRQAVASVKPHRLAWKEARRLARQDLDRIEVLDDGSLLVYGAPPGAAEAARRRRSPLRPATPPPTRKRRS